jgi:hypothetical protein
MCFPWAKRFHEGDSRAGGGLPGTRTQRRPVYRMGWPDRLDLRWTRQIESVDPGPASRSTGYPWEVRP